MRKNVRLTISTVMQRLSKAAWAAAAVLAAGLTSAISLVTCLAIFLAAVVVVSAPHVVLIYVTTWISLWKKPCVASPKRSVFRLWKSVTSATVAVRRQVLSRRPVQPVMVLVRYRCVRAFLPYSRPVHTARVAVR